MFVTDLRKQFYEIVNIERVLVLVASDVDALCAWKILQYLFQCDHVPYTLIPITCVKDLENAYSDNQAQIKHIVLINCGANVNILNLFQPPQDAKFYIIDCHRPLDIYNYYNGDQVFVLLTSEDDETNKVPPFEDLFHEDDDSDEEDGSGDDSDGSAPKRKRFDETVLEKRRERRLWEERKHEILTDYLRFTYYASSSAVLMFDLAWKMSRDSNELLWLAIVGLTEQYVNNKIDPNTYVLDCGHLQSHVSRHNSQHDKNLTSIDCMKINFDKELCLALYRHWSLHESIRHTMYTACKFKLWTIQGEKRLYEFLADLGLPLSQVKQKFASMDMQLRGNVRSWIEDKAEKYGLNQIVFASFHFQQGFRNKFCATDIVYAISALLESTDDNKTMADRFHNALDCLARSKFHLLHNGLALAKHQLSVIYKQVQTFLDASQVISTGPFLCAIIQEGSADVDYFSHPICLTNLAHFLLRAQIKTSRSKKIHGLPLVISAPSRVENGMSIVVGIPPISTSSTKNFFGQAFERASEVSRCHIVANNFDTTAILIRTEERSKFFDTLVNILQ